jgi:acetylglutamate kinase
MDPKVIKQVLTSLLTDIADKAKADALAGQSDIGSIFRRDTTQLQSLNPKAVEDAVAAINKATATKEGTRRLINGILVAAKAAAKIAFPA